MSDTEQQPQTHIQSIIETINKNNIKPIIMKKIYSLIIALFMLPMLANAATNMAFHKDGRTSITSLSEDHLYVSDEVLNPNHNDGIKTDAESYSIGAWVNVDKVMNLGNASNNSVIFGYRTRAHMNDNGAWHIIVNSNGKIGLKGWGTQCGTPVTSTSMPIGEWAHIMAVYNSDALTLSVYLNAEEIATYNLSAKIKFQDELQIFEFAGWQYSGDMDDATIYNKALSAEEVAASMAKATSVDGLVAYYTFEETIPGGESQFANQSTQECAADCNMIHETATAIDASHIWPNGMVYLVDSSEGAATHGSFTETAPALVEGRDLTPEKVTVSFVAGDGGSIAVYTEFDCWNELENGEEVTVADLTDGLYIEITTEEGYTVERLTINGEDVTSGIDEYGFYHIETIDSDLEISVTFAPELAGIEEVAVDLNSADVEYFNLQGMRVAAENLTSGIYVARQGEKTAKVLISK